MQKPLAIILLTPAVLYFCGALLSAECPPSWHRFENKCFFANLTAVHSKYNKELCDSLNATMVSVHSPAENEFLRRLLFIHYDSHKWAWLSRARNFNKSHGYLWQDASPFNYSNWVAPETECTACCEISLMTSGHWFGSNCNSWTFTQLCQKVMSPADGLAAGGAALDDNFFLSQFGEARMEDPDSIKPNVSELFEWLAYEVESVREDVQRLNESTGLRLGLEETLYERDTYLLTLLSLTVTLLLLILVAISLSYYMLLRKLRIMDSFCDKN